MKNIHIILLALLLAAGCSESFLDTEDLVKKNSDNFPGTVLEANQALASVYNELTQGVGFSGAQLIGDIMSDDRLGGGGQNDRDPQATEYFRVRIQNAYSSSWSLNYKGIYRANFLLSTLDNVNWGKEILEKRRIFGEVSFLRAYYYNELARLFGTVPLMTEPAPVNLPKATPAELYGQIAMDLKYAIDSLPDTPMTTDWRMTNMGRATKWAAEGYMARIFLFYTGYYGQTEIQLPDGSKITKAMVIDWVDDCVAHSGRTLVPDFRNLWTYAINEATNYGYAIDNGLHWVTDEGNPESIFEVCFVGLNTSVWGNNTYYCNNLDLMCGHRDPTAHLPFAHGWGFGPVNPNILLGWSDSDTRKKGSVWDVNDASEGTESYATGADMQWHETYLYSKKYIGVNISFEGGNVSYARKLYNASTNFMLNNVNNFVCLRLADVLLMGAELGSSHAQEYFDLVAGRSNSVNSGEPVSLDLIKKERRWEFAFEGLRYWDLLRWYQGEAGVVIQANESGAAIHNNGFATTIDASDNGVHADIAQRVRDTGGFLMIPPDEIQLSGGKLEQNPGWTIAGDYMY